MINLENNNLDYFVGDPEDSDIESYMAMPEEGEDVTTEETDDTQSEDTTIEETSEDVKVEEIEVETDNTSKAATEEPEVKEEKNVDEPSEEVSGESDAVEETSEDVKVEEIEVETENTAEAATEVPEVESVEDKEEKNLDESNEEESDAVEEAAETEDSPAPIEMDPEEAAHLAMQTKIVQATYGDIRKDLPQFHSGDTISVGYRVIEGSRSRVQIFEGVVIKISAGHGLDKTFTVRKISGGIGVERIFPFHSPNIESVKVLKEGKVRRAKLYYLRGLKGKATRIKDRIK